MPPSTTGATQISSTEVSCNPSLNVTKYIGFQDSPQAHESPKLASLCLFITQILRYQLFFLIYQVEPYAGERFSAPSRIVRK